MCKLNLSNAASMGAREVRVRTNIRPCYVFSLRHSKLTITQKQIPLASKTQPAVNGRTSAYNRKYKNIGNQTENNDCITWRKILILG